MKPSHAAVGWLILVGYFLVLAAALFFSGANLSHLAIRDIHTPFSWWEILAYLGVLTLGWYLVVVLRRRHAKGNEKNVDESK
jgi:hypothetical protein